MPGASVVRREASHYAISNAGERLLCAANGAEQAAAGAVHGGGTRLGAAVRRRDQGRTRSADQASLQGGAGGSPEGRRVFRRLSRTSLATGRDSQPRHRGWTNQSPEAALRRSSGQDSGGAGDHQPVQDRIEYSRRVEISTLHKVAGDPACRQTPPLIPLGPGADAERVRQLGGARTLSARISSTLPSERDAVRLGLYTGGFASAVDPARRHRRRGAAGRLTAQNTST
jgi:hypothetical protein